DRGEDAVNLDPDLRSVAFKQAGRTADRLHGEHTGQDRADNAADAVYTEHVEAFVVTQRPLDRSREEECAEAGTDADKQAAHRVDEAGGRRNTDEAGNGARRYAEHRRLTVE